VAFDMPSAGAVDLAIFDGAGRMVRGLIRGAREAGRHDVSWDGTDRSGAVVAPGAYFYRLELPGSSQTRRVVVLP